MKPTYFDIHSHLDDEAYNNDRDQVILRLRDTHTWTTTIGTDILSSQKALELAKDNENIFACAGIHPRSRGGDLFPTDALKQMLSHPKVVAVGECGLDYFKLDPDDVSEKKEQKAFFESQIHCALEYEKPLMIHCRDAYDDTIDILESYAQQYGSKLFGNMHFFAGSLDHARRLIAIGFTVSFTGVITFARNYDEVIQSIPLDCILAETDAPYVAPVPHRGSRNEPINVAFVIQSIAQIRAEDVEAVRLKTIENSFKLFRLT